MPQETVTTTVSTETPETPAEPTTVVIPIIATQESVPTDSLLEMQATITRQQGELDSVRNELSQARAEISAVQATEPEPEAVVAVVPDPIPEPTVQAEPKRERPFLARLLLGKLPSTR